MIRYAVLASILFSTTAIAQPEEDLTLIGYQYVCKAQIGDPYQSVTPSLHGYSRLTENGVRADFFATFSPAWTPTDQVYRLEKRPESMGKDASHVRWQMYWRKYDNAWSPKGFAVKFEDATIEMDFSSWRALPQGIVMLVGKSGATGLEYEKPFYAFTERWAGRTTGAGFLFPLKQILDVMTDENELSWAVYKGPITSQMPYSSRRGQGAIDMKAIRAVAVEFDKFHSALAADEADFKNKCKREPVYEDPDSQI